MTEKEVATRMHKVDSESLFEASVDEGMLGDEYELVGIYADGPSDSQAPEFEIFVVAQVSEV